MLNPSFINILQTMYFTKNEPPVICARHTHSNNTSTSLLQLLSNSEEYRQTEYEYFHYAV